MEKAKRRSLIFLIFFFSVLGIMTLLLLPFMRELETPEFREMFSAWITELGFRGILIFYFIQVTQNMIAIIPGGPIQVIAGAAFGTWRGLFILQAGVITSAVIIFALVKKFGNPVITRLLGANVADTWAFLKNEKKTEQVTFILFLITGVPKDALTYIAATTRFSLLQFLPISLIARFPGMLLSTLMGDAAMQGNWVFFTLLFGITAIAGLLGIQFKDRIIERFTALS